jgi:hypothetical protein
MTRSYFVALAFARTEDGAIIPGESIECSDAMDASMRAQGLSFTPGNVGSVAFSRTENDVGVFGDAVILAKFDDLPHDLTMLF